MGYLSSSASQTIYDHDVKYRKRNFKRKEIKKRIA